MKSKWVTLCQNRTEMQTVELTGGCGAHLAHSVDIYGHTSHLTENCFRTEVLLSFV